MVNPITEIVRSSRKKADAKKAARAKSRVQSDLARRYGRGTPEYYDAYNSYLYGREQWEFIKSHPGGTSERGYYVEKSQAAPSAGELSSPDIPVVSVVEGRGRTVASMTSPQETISQNTFLGSTLTESRDEIRAPPGGGGVIITKEEAMKERRRRTSGGLWMDLPDEEIQGDVASRIVSPQETVSVESERLRREQEARGRAIIDAPLEQSKKVSELIVGPVENIPKTETTPRGIASAVEWAITLPAETLRSPVTLTETAQDVREMGFMRLAGEAGQAIVRDPSGAGVKAGLTAALIVLPAAKVVRGLRGPGRSGRTTMSYEVTLGPEDVRATKVDYISDFVFKYEGQGIRGRGVVAMDTKGAAAAVDVRSFTVPEGRGYKTAVEARSVGRSKMDLLTGERIRGTVVSGDVPGGTKSTGVFLKTKQEGQLDIKGRPRPEEELSSRIDITQEAPGIDLAVGRRGTRKSILDQPLRETVDISGTKLISEARTRGGLHRKTYTREAIVDRKAFEERYLDTIFKDLGVTQDTLRVLPRGGQGLKVSTKNMVMAERAMQQAASAFQKTRPPTKAPKTRRAPSGVAAQADVTTVPVTGLGALPRQAQIPKEEPQIIRFPPSERPPGPVPGGVIDLDVASGLGVAEIAAQTQLRGQRGRSMSRTRLTQDIAMVMGEDQALIPRQGVAQRQAQDLISAQKTAQKTRQRTMIPTMPPRATPARQLIPRAPGIKAPRMPWLLPPPILELGTKIPKAAGPRREAPGMGFRYTPSLGGMLSGRELEKAPVGAVTGLELRPPVKKKKRR